ncbi:glycosyltransferase family 9 protein [Spongiivirga citrea]|uniref:Lipopolysaccharide heptosyltransferase family protein n=1 Tax=Spongiivirga citrea TaxID=1481457 RepID=A0A6M0CIZ6_9FLAO|nr:glycosyltransferase family 9 protein [Spongiivirga citrea]NER15954.1 lipopolysaccharide heptosyltransferase family protein [Spongiivirga citrea]
MKILVIQQKMIGDVLTSSVICDNLKKTQPDHEIHYMANENTLAVIEQNPSIDSIVVFKKDFRSSKYKFYRFLRSIKKEKYDIVIDAYGKLESNLVTLFSGAKTKIGWKKSYSKWIYTKTYNASQQQKNKDLAVNDRLLLIESFVKNEDEIIVKPTIHLTDKELNQAISFLKEHGISQNENFIMIGVLGSSHNKTYPIPYMAKLLDIIASKTQAHLLFNYIPSQFEEAEAIFNHCNHETKSQIKLEAFAPSLRSFLALLSHCDALIGNEGGAVNMAKALNIPTFSIFSPWINKEAWHLFGDDINQAIHLKDVKPELYRELNRKEQKENAIHLYQEFKPELIAEKLSAFLDILYPNKSV